jgi:ArsR family transcriptional regulator, lead/cadmium/zinc/bismuth-responsive transcriptional repressor
LLVLAFKLMNKYLLNREIVTEWGKAMVEGRRGRGQPVTSVGQGDTCEVKGADLERVRLGRGSLLDEEAYNLLAETFRTLADPSRAKIVHSLLRQELCTCDLAAIVCLSEPAVSQHLRLLRSLHLVKTRRQGKKVFYSLADAHVRNLLDLSLRHLAHEARVPQTVLDQSA